MAPGARTCVYCACFCGHLYMTLSLDTRLQPLHTELCCHSTCTVHVHVHVHVSYHVPKVVLIVSLSSISKLSCCEI